MTELHQADDLIQKYYDEIISPAELAELERQLIADPETARRFNEAGQTEHLIKSHFETSKAEVALRFEPVEEPPPPGPVPHPLWTWKTIRDHVWGPTGAVILHILILLALLHLATYRPPQKNTEYEITFVDNTPLDLDPFEKELEKIKPLRPNPAEDVNAENPFLSEEPVTDIETPPVREAAIEEPGLNIRNDVPGALFFKNLNIRSDEGKDAGLSHYSDGLGKYTEPAVNKALEWLKNHQQADGSWGPNKPAMTGLALLTFLAHGETLASEKYGATVEKAIRFLITQQTPEGRFCAIDQPGAYAHAIATYAISESYALSRIPSLKPVMEKAVQVILDGQQENGGWDYNYKKSARRDTSVAGWQIQALKAALTAGAENPELKEAFDKAIRDLKQAQETESGRFFYTDKSSHKTDGMTGIAVLCLQLTGHGDSREARQAMQILGSAECNWDKPPAWPLYTWYYITQAQFHQGGKHWNRWNSQFAREYVKHQNEDGSWTSPGPRSGDESGKEVNLGPVYSTTLAALTLQVYYRFLPSYMPVPTAPIDPESTNDIEIQTL